MSKDSSDKKKNTSKGVKNYTKIELLKQFLSNGNVKPGNKESK